MEKFVYEVGAFEFVDTKAFGQAWREAKVKAAELHAAIYRTVIKDESEKREVYLNAGCFLSVDFVKAENVKIF